MRVFSTRTGFTLIELLITMAIILLLAAMVIGVGFMWVDRAKVQVTYQRVEQVANQLKVYGELDGSACARLQQELELGGAIAFAPLYKIRNIVRMDGGGEQGNRLMNGKDWGGRNERYFPPPVLVWFEDNSSYRWGYGQAGSRDTKPTREIESIFRRVIEVVPPSQGPIPADYRSKDDDRMNRYDNWYQQTWRYAWPKTDWDQDEPGDTPPILRFPWGDPGLRIDGTPVDPDLPADEIVGWLDKRFYGTQEPDGAHPRRLEDVDIGEQDRKGFRGKKGVGVPNAWSVFGPLRYNNGTYVNECCSWAELQTEKQEQRVYMQRSDGSEAEPAANKPQPFDVGLMSPLKTMEFLQAAGMLPPGDEGRELYRSNRDPNKPWNDQWGHPLVIAYALFQPERYECIGNRRNQRKETTTRNRGLLLQASQKYYGYNRALYLVGGAAGPRLEEDAKWATYPAAWEAADDAEVLRGLWRQIRRVCKAEDWTEVVQGGGERPGSWSSGSHEVSRWERWRSGEEGRLACVITEVFEIQ